MRYLVGRDANAYFKVMEEMKGGFSLHEMAETLEVSKSGFYAHRQKPNGLRRSSDKELGGLIAQSFQQSRGTYGCRRVREDLRQAGRVCGKNRAARLMRAQRLCARRKGRFRPRTTDSRHDHPIAENWLLKVPNPERPGQIWQSDITYLKTSEEGWCYLAFTLDACSHRCVAHHCREDLSAQLTLTTFDLAVQRSGPLSPGLIHHSDRGSQYAAASFRDRLSAHGVTPSMSRQANPYDNALAESFVATLKTECFGNSIPPTKAIAKLMIFDYIESFYNTRRRHSSLGYRSPAQFEEELLRCQGQGCSGDLNKGGEARLPQRAGSSSPGCKQLPKVVQVAGNNPLTSNNHLPIQSLSSNLI